MSGVASRCQEGSALQLPPPARGGPEAPARPGRSPSPSGCRLSGKGRRPAPRSQLPGLLDDREALDDVAFLDVIEVGDLDPALEAGLDFPGVVLDALEGTQRARVGDAPLAHQA